MTFICPERYGQYAGDELVDAPDMCKLTDKYCLMDVGYSCETYLELGAEMEKEDTKNDD